MTALAVGCVTHDRYGDVVRAGGAALYAARAWRALDAEARLVATLGRDFRRHDALEGVQASVATEGRTLTFLNEHPRVVAGDAAPVATPLLPPSWSGSDVVLLAPVFGELEVEAWLDAVTSSRVGLVLQGLVRRAGEPDRRLAGGRRVGATPPGLPDGVWRRLSLVVLSDEDLAGLGDAAASAQIGRIRTLVPTVVVTQGQRGSLLLSGGQTWKVGIAPARVVDPTGAGDVFTAILLIGQAVGMPVQQAVRAASAAASVVVEGIATDALDELRECVACRMEKVSVCAQ